MVERPSRHEKNRSPRMCAKLHRKKTGYQTNFIANGNDHMSKKTGTGKVALITGVTGQDGAYLSELLLSKGYTVHGIKRRASSFNTDRVDHLYHDQHEKDVRFFLHYGDMTDSTNLIRIIQDVQPDELYNLAAQSHVAV